MHMDLTALLAAPALHAGASKPHHLVDANGVVLGFSHFGMLAAARWIKGQTRTRLEQALAESPGGLAGSQFCLKSWTTGLGQRAL